MKQQTLLTAVLVACFAGFCSQISYAQEKPQPKNLFAQRDLAKWDFHVAEKDVKVGDVFSFDNDGVLSCTGKPFGYLATPSIYKNYKLSLEYAWPDGVEPTNSGVFLRINSQPKESFLPRGIEAQLHHGNAGDLWAFHGMRIDGPKDRHTDTTNPEIGPLCGVKKIEGAEKQPGQWNLVEILVVDSLVVVSVNGKIVNWTNQAETTPGKVGLQSEGGPIKFRNFILTEL